LRRLFGDSPTPRVLFDSDASEQKLDELAGGGGELGKYRYVHLATHGEVDDAWPLRSAVILSRDTLPDPGKQLLAGKPVYDGRLTAEEILRTWNLEKRVGDAVGVPDGPGQVRARRGLRRLRAGALAVREPEWCV